MPWLRLDDRFDRHPKITALRDREFRVWLRVLLYCAAYRTSGLVQKHADVTGLSETLRGRFRSVGLLDVIGGEDWVHDWGEFNPTDATNADRQARWREKKRLEEAVENVTSNVTEAVTSGVTEAVTVTDPRALAGARDPYPNPLPTLRAEAESLAKESSRTETRGNGLPAKNYLHTLHLLNWIGADADDRTSEVVTKMALGLPEAALVRVAESIRGKTPENRARYVVGALKSERAAL